MILKRLGLPVGLFVVLALLAANQDNLLLEFGSAVRQQVLDAFNISVQVGIWLSAAFLVNRLLEVFFWDWIGSRLFLGTTPRLMRDVGMVIVYTAAVSGIIGFVFKQSVTGIAAAGGVVGLVVGLALRGIILDIFTGVAVNLDRPYKIGDFILLQGGYTGQVLDTNWRTTRLVTSENNTVVIPNSRIGEMVLTNFSVPDAKSEFEIVYTLEFSVPADRALRVLAAAALAAVGPRQLLADPEPKARIKGISTLGVEYKVKYWIDCSTIGPGKARHLVNKSVLDHLHYAGLTLAHQQQDIFYAPMPSRELDRGSTADRVQLLQRLDLFATLTVSEAHSLAQTMRYSLHKQGTQLVRQGEAGESMFIVTEGLLNVLVTSPETLEMKQVATVDSGGFFGEMSLMTGEPRSASVIAATDTVVYEIGKEEMAALLAQRPELAESISCVIARRRLEVEKRMAESPEAVEAQEQNLAQQILGRIRLFFRGAIPHAPDSALAAASAV